MNTAYSYVRFSSRSQMTGDSLSRQLTRAREYAHRHGLELDEGTYQDLGISAFKGKNASDGALGAFLEGVDQGLIPNTTTLLVESLDRISRANIMDALPLFMGIINRGVTVVTLVDDQVYRRDQVIKDHGMSLFGSMMVLIRAHEESVMKSVRAKSGIAARLARGLKSGPAPFWLKATPDRTSFEVVESQADIVREIFLLRFHSIGSLRIAHHLNETYGWKWGSPQVARLLKSPAVIGVRMSVAGHEPRADYYPTVVDKRLFFAVQSVMAAPKNAKRGRRPRDEPNLFTGLARCAKCGGTMRFFRETKNVSQRYLKCLNAVEHKGCDAGFINYDAFEKEALGWLLLDQDAEWIKLFERKPTRNASRVAEIEALKAAEASLLDALAKLERKQPVIEKLNIIALQIRELEAAEMAAPPDDDRLFAEKAWELVERHEDAKLGDDKEAFYAVRREIKTAFQRSIQEIKVFPESRKGDEHICKFSVQLKGIPGERTRRYSRPALIRVKGVWNPRRRPVFA